MLSRDEIEEAVAAAPRSVVLGTGRDAVTMAHRGVESNARCIVHSSPYRKVASAPNLCDSQYSQHLSTPLPSFETSSWTARSTG